MFATEVASINGTVEKLKLSTKLSGDDVAKTCAGPVNQTDCILVSAIAAYDVIVTDRVITFAEPPSNPRIITRANNTAVTEETISKFDLQKGSNWIKTTLSGIANVFNYQFSTRAGLAPPTNPGGPVNLDVNSMSWYLFQQIANFEAWNKFEDCAPAWNDPRDKVMAAMNELMFRAGIYAAQIFNETYLQTLLDPGLNVHYNVSGIPETPINVFKSNFHYFAGAAIVELLTILLIATTFNGWWRLGRHVSFSPLEVAKVCGRFLCT